MRHIFKYKLVPFGTTVIDMPARAEIRSVGNQCESIVMWMAVNLNAPTVSRKFICVATGDAEPACGRYIETVMLAGGTRVAHIYEILS